MKLFSTTASQKLSEEVAKTLGTTLAQSEIIRFDNSEVRVRINEDVSRETCIVLGSSSNPTDTHLMELFFFADALARGEAEKVIAFMPYFGYARQNIQHRTGENVSVNVVIRILETVGFDEVTTFELHDEAIAGVFITPFTHLSAFSLLSEECKKYLVEKEVDENSIMIASPDQGGVERARSFGKDFFGKDDFEIIVIEKNRDQDHKHVSTAVDLYGDVSGKTVILVDDVTTSGGTLINAANLCKERGATGIIAAVTHHDFGPGTGQRIQDSIIEAFFTTDTIVLKDGQSFDKLHEVSVAPLIAKYIQSHF